MESVLQLLLAVFTGSAFNRVPALVTNISHVALKLRGMSNAVPEVAVEASLNVYRTLWGVPTPDPLKDWVLVRLIYEGREPIE